MERSRQTVASSVSCEASVVKSGSEARDSTSDVQRAPSEDTTKQMTRAAGLATRCGIDTVEIARIDRLLRESASRDLERLFSAEELAESGDGPGRAASLAARFAAKEACVKLFPREAALGEIEPADFAVARDAYGAPQAVIGPRAASVLGRNRIRAIALSLTHDRLSASAVALAVPEQAEVPLAGRSSIGCSRSAAG